MLKITVLGNTNLDFLRSEIKTAFGDDEEVDMQSLPYLRSELLIKRLDGDLYKFQPDIIVLAHRLDDLYGGSTYCSFLDRKRVLGEWNDYINLIMELRNNTKATLFVTNAAMLTERCFPSILPKRLDMSPAYFIYELICKLHEKISILNDVHIIDLQNIITKLGVFNSCPKKYWYLARAPFSKKLDKEISDVIVNMWRAVNGKTIKVIVLDLDNTLWGGILGEDGISGIKIGGDYPGNVFSDIQKFFLTLMNQGFILALCSKNDKKNVLAVLDDHHEMILKRDHFASIKANWEDKTNNIREISSELGLNLNSFCFIDDNPLEREEVRERLPMVVVPEMPREIAEWPEYIGSISELNIESSSKEDLNRTKLYKIRNTINKGLELAVSRTDFLKGLSMKLYMQNMTEFNIQRIFQLISKTNQFNMTANRYKLDEISSIADECIIICIRLRDRLGSDEIVGVLIIRNNNRVAIIQDFILSCRVLGRDIEHAVLAWAYNYLKKKKFIEIHGLFVKNENNQLACRVYLDNKFDYKGDGVYQRYITGDNMMIPDWYDIVDELS